MNFFAIVVILLLALPSSGIGMGSFSLSKKRKIDSPPMPQGAQQSFDCFYI
jgi:hypothetical protein